MEYRGVYLLTGQEIFHFGPMYGTNNIGEFLAIVHGLALMKQKGINMPIYSDSRNALNWVKQKKCKTKLERTEKTEKLFQLIERAEKWLHENQYTTPLLNGKQIAGERSRQTLAESNFCLIKRPVCASDNAHTGDNFFSDILMPFAIVSG